ncbi:SH3 domain-containing protein [Persephonella sp.]
MKRAVLILFIMVVIAVDLYFAKQLFLRKQGEKITEKSNGENSTTTALSVKETPQKEQPPPEQKVETQEEPQKIEKKEEKTPEKIEKKQEIKTATEENKGITVEPGYMIAKVFVNLRKEPDVNSEIVTVIRKGASVKVIGKKANHWKRVLYRQNDRVYEGWVDDRFFIIGESLKSR